MFNFNWDEGTKIKNGFNFGMYNTGMTWFRFSFLLPLKKDRHTTEYVDPFTKDSNIGFKGSYFSVYFRLRKAWPRFYDFFIEKFIAHDYVATLI